MDVLFVMIVTIIFLFFTKKLKEKGSQIFQKKKPFVYVVPSSPKKHNQVSPDNTPLHIRRGWKQQQGNRITGYYRTRYGAWKGLIEKRGDIFKVYIFNPPTKKLKNHSRWICFHNKGGGRWLINLAINPKDQDVGAIIFFVENLIIKSFQMS